MIRSELVTRIAAQNPHLYDREIEALIRVIFDRMAEALVQGDRIELRGLGTFENREQSARSARNPRTGEKVAVDARTKVHFKPSKTMRARLNWQEPEGRS